MSALPTDRARAIADLIDEYDQAINDAQDGKRETFSDLRVELEGQGLDKAAVKIELAALKRAIRLRQLKRSKPEKVEEEEEREVLALEYLGLIEGARAPRATRTRGDTKQHSPEGASGRSVVDLPRTARDGTTDGDSRERPATHPNARPETYPRTQSRGLPEDGRNGSAETTVGITGASDSVDVEQSVTSLGAGAGEGTGAPVQASAPAPDLKRGPLLDPDHAVSPFMRKLLCDQYGLPDEAFDEFRAGAIRGLTPDAARDLALQAVAA